MLEGLLVVEMVVGRGDGGEIQIREGQGEMLDRLQVVRKPGYGSLFDDHMAALRGGRVRIQLGTLLRLERSL